MKSQIGFLHQEQRPTEWVRYSQTRLLQVGVSAGWPAGFRTVDATIKDMEEAPMRVTLTEPGLAGSYDVVEQRQDGTLVLRPETSDEVIERFADRGLSGDEALEALDRLTEATARERE